MTLFIRENFFWWETCPSSKRPRESEVYLEICRRSWFFRNKFPSKLFRLSCLFFWFTYDYFFNLPREEDTWNRNTYRNLMHLYNRYCAWLCLLFVSVTSSCVCLNDASEMLSSSSLLRLRRRNDCAALIGRRSCRWLRSRHFPFQFGHLAPLIEKRKDNHNNAMEIWQFRGGQGKKIEGSSREWLSPRRWLLVRWVGRDAVCVVRWDFDVFIIHHLVSI